MTNIERIQKEGAALLLASGWAEEKIAALKECLIDFTNYLISTIIHSRVQSNRSAIMPY